MKTSVLRVDCPACQTMLEVETDQRREVIECYSCGQTFIGLADEITREPDRIRRRETHNADICSMVGLVTTLVGLFFFWCPPVGLIVTVIGLILSVMGLKSKYRGVAISGLVLGVVAVVYGIGLTGLFVTVAFVNQEEFGKRQPPVNRQQPMIQFK